MDNPACNRKFYCCRKVKHKEQYLALALESMGNGVITTDCSGRIASINSVAQQLTGWRAENATGCDLSDVFKIIVGDDKSQPLEHPMKQVLDKQEAVQFSNHTLLLAQDGKKYHITYTASPIQDEQGDILGMVLVFNNVTDKYLHLQAEKALAEKIRLSEQHLRLFQEQSPLASIEWNLQCQVVHWNKAAEKIFGYTLEEIRHRNFIDLVVPEELTENIQKIWEKLVSGHGGEVSVNQNITKAGHRIVCEWHNAPLRDEQGKVIGAISLVRDITEQQRMEDVLIALAAATEGAKGNIFGLIAEKLANLFELSNVILASVESGKKYQVRVLACWSNGRLAETCNYKIDDIKLSETGLSNCQCDDKALCQFIPQEYLPTDNQISHCKVLPLQSSNGDLIGLLMLMNDKPINISANGKKLMDVLVNRATVELERTQSEKKLKLAARIFSETHESIVITDQDGVILDVNPAYCKMTGFSRQEVIGQNPRIVKSGVQPGSFYRDLWKTLQNKGVWQGEFWNKKKNGEIYAEHKTITRMIGEDAESVLYVGLGSDITQIKQQQNELEQMAHFDLLTRLPNRALFADRMKLAIAHSKRVEKLLAVCFIDLDQFKPVNDTYGHQVGDQVLVEVSRRLIGVIREQDTAARLSGDEFALLLGDIDSQAHCERVMQRIHERLSEPYAIEDMNFSLSASSGITLYPQDDADIDTLLRHADSAMYQSKLKGRNRYSFFDVSKDIQISSHHKQLNKMSEAFERQEFCLYYQPKVDMQSGHILGAEALIRWLNPKQGLIPPIEFLPYLDGTDMEIQIGNWVLEQAWKQLKTWSAHGHSLEVSVNISSHHLQWPGFYQHLKEMLALQPEIDAGSLQLEILESNVLGDVHKIRQIIKKCRDELGISVALDDFGTGYSSLTHLRRLPVNMIKIDRTFVRDMLEDENDLAIIEGIIGLAKAFKRDVIAEGVESIEHGKRLIQMGCMKAQGFVIDKPMPADDFIDWVKNYQPDKEWKSTVVESGPYKTEEN